MKRFVICIFAAITFCSCGFKSDADIIRMYQAQYPDEIVVGTLIQLSNNQMTYGEYRGGVFLGHGEISDEYFYTGMYKDNSGLIKTFKLPATDVYFVESDSLTITKTGIHEYIVQVVNRVLRCYHDRWISKFVASPLYIKSENINIIDFDDPMFERPKIRICIPMNSIQNYINITY